MTIRQLIKLVVDADDLDCQIGIETGDGADLGLVQREGTTGVLVLTLSSHDVAVLAKAHAVRQADGDPIALEKLRDAGVIS